jgi:XTP/dITP diphosphohydrolase
VEFSAKNFSNKMNKIIFASNNINKVIEIRKILDGKYEILTLKEAGLEIEIPEPHDTMELNALEKARTIFNLKGTTCFAEDSGLEVDALGGEPGVLSARYAGTHGDDEKNIEKLLNKMQGVENRKARFRTVISLIENGENKFFVGICEGTLAYQQRGNNGFGYDPIFIPMGYDKTFAESTPEEKNAVSHRKKAMKQMIEYLLPENNRTENKI